MATATIAIHHLTAYLEGISDLNFIDKAFYTAIGEELTISTQARAEQEISPEGKKWAPLSERYQAKKSKQDYGNKILRKRGYLLDTLRSQATDTELRFGSNRPYAALHQFGGKFKAFGKYDAVMPARPYLGLSEDDKAAIQEAVEEAYALWLAKQAR